MHIRRAKPKRFDLRPSGFGFSKLVPEITSGDSTLVRNRTERRARNTPVDNSTPAEDKQDTRNREPRKDKAERDESCRNRSVAECGPRA